MSTPTTAELKTALHFAESQGKLEDLSRFRDYCGEFIDCKHDPGTRELSGYMLIGTSDGDIFVRVPSFHGIRVWEVAAKMTEAP